MSTMGVNVPDIHKESEMRKGLRVPEVFECLVLVVPEVRLQY